MTVVTRLPLWDGSKEGDDLRRSGHAAGALVGIDLLAVSVDVERAGAAQFQSNRGFEFALDVLFQAHGLKLDVVSEEAALDDDFHTVLTL
jgi:hypothetical protein